MDPPNFLCAELVETLEASFEALPVGRGVRCVVALFEAEDSLTLNPLTAISMSNRDCHIWSSAAS